MATPYAFVTLVTSDFYLPGALALVAALKDLHPSPPTSPEVEFQTVCLVTPETVDVSSIKLLRRAYNVVIGVEIIEQEDDRKLRLLGRPDLNTVLTKLHIFRLTQYSKLIFLDADVLPLQPLSHLFAIPHEFAAVPDVGWPDIFNSGVLVVTPGEDKFRELMELQKTKGSWDGGDQGLLNEWRGSDWHRLSFVYNTTPTAAYTYAPAYERFGSGIKAIHFIGPDKPWKNVTYRSPGIKSAEATLGDGTKRVYNYEALVDRWYEVYDNHYRMEPASIHEDFEVQQYSSAWDQGGSLGAEMPVRRGVSASGSGGALGLDELRRVAVEGLGALGGNSGSVAPRLTEGEYRSMPLEGRVDLMRPRKAPEREPSAQDEGSVNSTHQAHQAEATGTPRPTHIDMPQQGGEFRTQTLPTPAPNEIPPTPYHHGGSLPPTQTPTPYYGPPQLQSHGHNTLQVFYQPQTRNETASEFFESHNPPTSSHYSQPSHSRQHSSHLTTPSSHDQRTPYYPPESSESEATPPAQYPPSHPSRQLRTGHGSWSPQHFRGHPRTVGEAQPAGTPQQSHSPPRQKDHEHQFETPRAHYNKEHHVRLSPGQDPRQHSTHLHLHHERGSGDRTPTQGQPRPGHVQGAAPQHRSHHVPTHSQGSIRHHDAHRQHHQAQHVPASVQHHEPQPVPPRPISPPKLSWNPAVEPPPKEPPPNSTFPEDTYFPNVWDQNETQHYGTAYPAQTSPGRNDPANVLFSPPPPPTIPEQLLREGQYANVLGSAPAPVSPESVSSPPAPDRNKVHAIFPWEEKPRHVPRRVFPKADSPPPMANYIESERTSSPISTPPTQVERPTPQVRSPTSPLSLPWGIGFSNAWDTVPSIQRYASKLVGSPKIFPHHQAMAPPPPRDDNWREQWEKQRAKEIQEQYDASGMDGDDEDEDEEDESTLSEGSSTKGKNSRRRARAASMGSKSKKKYRSRGIQAYPETSEQAIQVTIITAEDRVPRMSSDAATETEPDPALAPSVSPVLPSGGLGSRRQWAGEIQSALLPSAVPRELRAGPEQTAGTPIVSINARAGLPFPSLATPSGLRSPATLGSPRTYSPPRGATPAKVPTPPRVTSPPQVSSPLRGPSSPVAVMSAQTASPRPSASPQLALRTSSPRPSASPRKMSASSVQGSGSSRANSPIIGRAQQSTPSPKHTRLSSLQSPYSPGLQRSISAESGVTPSPSTTTDSLATPEGTPLAARRGSRVWDPARGVDVFKRGSEEVLARFLRMGSFDGEEGKQQPTA